MNSIREAIVLSLCLSLIFAPSVVLAAPQGGRVVGGSASIQQSGANTTINQSSDRAVINWNSFDIARHEAVRHNMPSSSSAALHRVVGGGGASQIQGLLQSNGNIYLVNPAGVVIHKGARINTNGFVATSRDISNSNFMSGKMVFDKPGLAGAQVINQGEITVRESGLAALVAPSVRNEGLIAAKLGKVALASADAAWSLDMHGDDLITFTLDEKAVNSLHGADGKPLASVANSGSIKAEGGVVVLTAAQLDGIVGSVVNSGEVSAASAEIAGGMITFKGQGSGVDISNTGTVDVSSTVADAGSVRMDTDGTVSSSGSIAATGGKKGGKVTLTGRDVALQAGAKIDASGNTGGGTVLVGGNALGKGPERNARTTKVEQGAAIHADAKVKGDGGQVVVWSDETTTFDGSITAQGGSEGGNGGQVETSGKDLKIGDAARVSTLAPKGLFGDWLLDPEDFIVAADGDMSGVTISNNLMYGNVTINSFSGSEQGNGDIIVKDNIAWDAPTKLTFDAYRDVVVYNNIDIFGDYAELNVRHGNNGLYKNQGGVVSFYGENQKLFIGGEEYALLKDVHGLQWMIHNMYGRYALANSIDASETKFWNEGQGFHPIGWRNHMFQGKFYGNGHTISGLYINRPEMHFVGLFGYAYDAPSIIANVALTDAEIVGYRYVGILAGCNGLHWYKSANGDDNAATIINCSVDGTVHGMESDTGGLAGRNHGCIISSVSHADVYGDTRVGGLVGKNEQYITNSYSTGMVTGNWSVGGLVGTHKDNRLQPSGTGNGIFNSYSTGLVKGKELAGALIGGEDPFYYSKVVNSFFDIESSGLSYSRQGVGLFTEYMKDKSSYYGWDFDNVWDIKGGKYPELRIFNVKKINMNNTEKENFDYKNNEGWIDNFVINNKELDNNHNINMYLFNIHENVFQNAKDVIAQQEYLREANVATLIGRTSEIFSAKLIATIAKDMAGKVVLTAVAPAGGIIVGAADVLSSCFGSSGKIKNFLKSVINSPEVTNLIEDTLLTYIFTNISKEKYLDASRLENNIFSKENTSEIIDSLYISYAYNAIASYYSEDKLNTIERNKY